jgi:hypothetical protein
MSFVTASQQPGRDDAQDDVADRVAEGVVDGFEVIDVEHDHRDEGVATVGCDELAHCRLRGGDCRVR